MKKRHLALLLACTLLLCSCQPEGGSSSASAGPADSSMQEVEIPQPEHSPFTLGIYPAYSIHPVLTESRANLTLAPLLYESLFTVDTTFSPIPQLCQSYTASGDQTIWTFTLKPGITFSDGTPLTGVHVANALRAAQAPGSRYAMRLGSVIGIRGEGDQVTVTLNQPNAAFPVLLDVPIALGEGDRPLGTGPYVLYDQGGSLSLRARSDWWRGEPLPIDQVHLTAMSQTDEVISAFNSGEVTLLDSDLTKSSELGYSGSYEVWDYPTTDLIYLGFQTQYGLCQDPGVRRAIARAVDRETIADTVFARHAVASSLPVHPNSALYDAELAKELAYDPGTLSELGLEGRSLTLVVNIEDTAKSAVANHVERQLEQAGLRVTVKRLEWTQYCAVLEKGQFDLYLGEVYLPADFDISALVSPEKGLNYGRWQDPAVLGMLSSLQMGKGEGRQAAAHALYRYLGQSVPIAPLCFKNGSVLTQYGRLEHLAPVSGNVFANLSDWTVQ